MIDLRYQVGYAGYGLDFSCDWSSDDLEEALTRAEVCNAARKGREGMTMVLVFDRDEGERGNLTWADLEG